MVTISIPGYVAKASQWLSIVGQGRRGVHPPCRTRHYPWSPTAELHGPHQGGEPREPLAVGPELLLPRALTCGNTYERLYGGAPPKLQLPALPAEAKPWTTLSPRRRTAQTRRASSRASTTNHGMRCLWQPRWGKPNNCMRMWAKKLLGQETPTPPPKGAPPKATSGTTPSASAAEPAPEEAEEEESDMELTAEERAEVARIEEECSELERRMRNLSATQQRSLF